MSVIKEKDFVESIASALQYISYYHSEDFILAMTRAYELEKSVPAKDAILQILSSSSYQLTVTDLFAKTQVLLRCLLNREWVWYGNHHRQWRRW